MAFRCSAKWHRITPDAVRKPQLLRFPFVPTMSPLRPRVRGCILERYRSVHSVLLQGGMVWDGTGSVAFPADLLIEGNRIAGLWTRAPNGFDNAIRIDVRGHTVLPGLVDGHAHLAFLQKADIVETGEVPPEEHMLQTARHARIVLEAGFTSCLSGGSAKPRLDVALRDAINAGKLPGPRLLAASPELTNTGNLGDERRMHIYRESVAMVVDGASEVRQICRTLLREGVDTIKLNVSGNQTTPTARSDQTVMRADELATAVEVTHAHGKRVAAHARAAASIKLALNHGVDILYHCEYADEECLDLLEAARDRVFVAPAVGLLHSLLFEAQAWGITYAKAAAAGVALQLERAQMVFGELRKRGVRVLIGGDYGFPWTPHGTNARDIELFVQLLGYSPCEALVAATRTGAEAMMLAGQAGKLAPGFLADLLVVSGTPHEDVRVLQKTENIKLVMKDGEIYKSSLRELRQSGRA
ncbi:MAG: amidohydrolase family protein [Proteobacteria bacterium]|nr:MAG: amidohydrolase family protein [Pseudomonadota bacterium]